MKDDMISRMAVLDAVDNIDWYHQNKNGEMVHGANDDEHQAWYKADEVYMAIESVPSAQPNGTNTVQVDDCISRQAAIDALEKVAEFFPWRVPGNRDSYDRYNEAWNDAMGRAEIEIENLPSAQPGWIPCSERLPEDGDYKPFSYYDDGAVLFCTKDGKIGFGWYYESTKQWANEDDKSPGEVIKWMPIPG